MALTKKIKIGGAYYKGYSCAVGGSPGDYTVTFVNVGGAAMNSLSITPDAYGVGDTMKIQHMDDASGTGSCMAIIGEDIYNVGRNASIALDFPAAELVNSGESVLFTYTNTASVAMNVHLLVEYVGIKKTA